MKKEQRIPGEELQRWLNQFNHLRSMIDEIAYHRRREPEDREAERCECGSSVFVASPKYGGSAAAGGERVCYNCDKVKTQCTDQ